MVTTFLLNSGSNMAAETTTLQATAPDNTEAVAYIRDQIARFAVDSGFFTGFTVLDETASNPQTP